MGIFYFPTNRNNVKDTLAALLVVGVCLLIHSYGGGKKLERLWPPEKRGSHSEWECSCFIFPESLGLEKL